VINYVVENYIIISILVLVNVSNNYNYINYNRFIILFYSI